MNRDTNSRFGNLTLKKKKLYDITEILSKENSALDILFNNQMDKLDSLTVVAAERQAALENLRDLTTQLQTKRLRDKSKSSCKYFSL